MNIIKKSFYESPTIQVAHDLLGKRIVRRWHDHTMSGIIVETEAYCGEIDPASHAYRGQTLRNKAMFGPAGHSYVYFIYGNHHCLNIVAKEKDAIAGGVLVRSLIPVEGIDLMKKVRHTDVISHLTNGPGKIGQALHLHLTDNHIDVTKKGALYITHGIAIDHRGIIATPRIGITKGREYLWRFVVTKEMQHQLLEDAKHHNLMS